MSVNEPTNEELAKQVSTLEGLADIDRHVIADLQAHGVLDRAWIANLETQGGIDRAAIAGLERQHSSDLASIDALEAQGVLDRETINNLEIALRTSRRIGAAIGVLMTIHKTTETQAFELLRVASMSTHRKLRDVANDVVDTGALPLD